MGHDPFNEQHKEMFRLRNRVVHQSGGRADLPAHHQGDKRLVMHIFTLSEELGREHCNRDCPVTLFEYMNNRPCLED